MTKVLIALTGAKEWSLKDGSKHFGGCGPQSLCFHMTLQKGWIRGGCCYFGRCPSNCRSS